MRLPVLPTIIVAAAAVTMIMLGVWQLGRADEKAALLSRFREAQTMSSEVSWPLPGQYENALYRHARVDCARVRSVDVRSGRSARGALGWAQIAKCDLPGGGMADIALGWTQDPAPRAWRGGEIGGIVAPDGRGVKLVASPAPAGMEPLVAPDPGDLPNNHLAYAWQWFFFAATAVVIYALVLRRRNSPMN